MEFNNALLEKYIVQLRRIEEHREKNAENHIRLIYKNILKELNSTIAQEYVISAEDDVLDFGMLERNGRYARFLEEVERNLNSVSQDLSLTITEAVENTYSNVWESMNNVVNKATDSERLHEAFKSIKTVTPEMLKNAVSNPIMQMALEKNYKDIVYNIRQSIAIGLMNGDRMTTMAKRIKTNIDKEYYKAVRIARTETHRVREAGMNDFAQEVNQSIKDAGLGTDYVYVKIWHTMQDERVRPNVRRKTKKGWKTYKSKNGADHQKMEGKVVLADEKFELGNGATAPAPSQSGVAAQDINCRCYLEYKFMKRSEYEALTGKKIITSKETIKDTKASVKEKLAQKNVRIDNKVFGINEEFMIENMNQIDALLEKYPKMREYLNGDELAITKARTNSSFIAAYRSSYMADSKKMTVNEITYNPSYFKDRATYIKNQKAQQLSGWKMKITEGMESIYTTCHEFGHYIEQMLYMDYIKANTEEFNEMLQKARSARTIKAGQKVVKNYQDKFYNGIRKEIIGIYEKEYGKFDAKTGISDYGKKNSAEFFAEAFASLECNKEPAGIGKAMKKYLERVLK